MGKLFVRIIAIVVIIALWAGMVGVFSEDGASPIAFSAAALTPNLPFADVSAYDWFFRSVVWAYENEIMNGVSETSFEPFHHMTRAMLVTILWRYAGRPDAREASFNDVRRGMWYSDAVAWASENGIVTGHSATEFAPNEPINREQMYTILYRYMNFAGLTIALDDEVRLLRFSDEAEISSWALEAMFFMHDAQVMFRYSTLDTYARPKDNAFRGEIAAAMFFFDLYSEPLSLVYE